MKLSIYPKLVIDSMRRNSKLYGPYLSTCILMIAVFYIMHFLGYSDVMKGMAGGATAIQMMRFGTGVIAVFGSIFLFYTQSTLIKGRKKEFGLYSILGMNKHNLGAVIFYDTMFTWIVSIVAGVLVGIALSKLAELGFTRMIAVPTKYTFEVSLSSVITTVIVYTVIFFVMYLNSVRQVRFASPVQLVRADKAGEKPPRSNWFLGVTGLVILGAGYYITLRIKQPMAALMYFFVAVLLIVIGTYLVMVAGSVILCKLLQRNKSYYYKTNHFVSVSSMTYRMKRNGAGLASICLLLTAVLVMISSTSALFVSADDCLNARYPNEIGAFACKYGYDEELVPLGERLDEDLKNVAREYGASVTNNQTYYEYSISGYYENDRLDVILNSESNLAFIDYNNVMQAIFIDVDVYNSVFGHSETVKPGEALVGTAKKIEIGDNITIGDVSFVVSKRIDDSIPEIDPAAAGAASPAVFLIVDDVQDVARNYIEYKDFNGEPMLAWFWNSRFDTGLGADEQIALAKTLDSKLHEELGAIGFDNVYCESHEGERDDFVSTFGGLFFLGIMLSIIFMVSCVIIIYYKQISEGFEDQSRFEIMQKIGMTKEDIRKSINSQMLTVFLIPLLFACVHLAIILPIINKLLMLFGLFNFPILLLTAAVSVLLCAALYVAIYMMTSREYYRIVADM